ncbi:ATP-binding cassette sub- C member 8, partial [Rhizoclosmatium hyalinum]
MAIKSACFEQDLLSMPAGLMSVLGEKGVRLSGGQKSRIALARAIYSDTDIILLDDPLAPLDARVSRSVLQETILTALKNKTVVMTTHNHKILEHADSILFINNSGQVSQHTYAEFSKSEEYYQFTKTQNVSVESDRKTKSSHHEDSEVSDIVVAEDMEVGKVKLRTYAGYVKASGGWGHFIVMAAFIGLYQATVVLMNQWLTWWCKGTLDLGTTSRIMWYIVIGCISIFLFTCYNAVIQIGVMKNVKNLHENALISVLAAPISWWEGQLVGRLMNRFTKDIQTVENQMILLLMNLSGSVGWLVSVWVILAINTPVLLAFFIPLGVLYLVVLWYFPRTFRQLKRLEATQRSPLYSHISEMFAGVSTIVSSGGEAYWVTKMKSLLEESNQPLFFKFGAEVWILLRLELISALLVFVLAALTSKQSLFSVENLGVALLNANSLTVIMNLILQNCIAMETEMVCVERLLEYSHRLLKEDALTLESDPSDDEWPKTGTIVFRDVSAFYQSSPNVPALKTISLMIEPGSRICIAGRTGSGKSTLIASLLRFVRHTGEIIIDGHEINTLGLNTLRAAFEVVPQDATLLSGTIRTWLDPLSTHTDAELWDSVSQASLHPFLTSLNGLDTLIEENGDTFSVGQCQLLYFARILLRRPKIVLLDEATSSVDPETENLLR